MHHTAAAQTPLLGAEAAGDAAAADQGHDEDEHDHTDDDADKLADTAITNMSLLSRKNKIERGCSKRVA